MNSIEEIKEYFGFENYDRNHMLTELKEKRSILHPDKSGGDFLNDEKKSEYHKIDASIKFLEDNPKTENQLVNISQVNELVSIVKEIIPDKKEIREEKLEARVNESSLNSITMVKKRYSTPKWTLSTISGILSFLWLFPSQISEHPVLSMYIDINSSGFTTLWLGMVIIAIYIWIISGYLNNRLETRNRQYKLKSFQNRIFRNFLLEQAEDNQSDNFVKENLISYLQSRDRNHYRRDSAFLLGLVSKLDFEFAESIAEIILLRAEEKGIVWKAESKSMDDIYVFNISREENAS